MSDATDVQAPNAEPADEAIADDAITVGGLDVRAAVAGLNSAVDTSFYSTISADSFADKLAIAKAVNNSEPVDEHLGEEFNLKDYIVQVVEIADGQTGEIVSAPRVTLISDEGNAYHGTSKGLLTAIRNLNATLGDPSNWGGETVRVKIVMKGQRPRSFFTIEYV
jgi:hypothetical protein